MDPKTLALLVQLIQAVFSTVPIAIEDVLKIKAMLSQSPNIEANIKALASDAVGADQDTIDRVNAWLTANGHAPIQA